jgi:hypothetical protein
MHRGCFLQGIENKYVILHKDVTHDSFPIAVNKAYQDSGTLFRGSGGPLSSAGPVCSLLRTGWGPRGDSGSARGRVRATQPASFSLSPFWRDAYFGSHPKSGRGATRRSVSHFHRQTKAIQVSLEARSSNPNSPSRASTQRLSIGGCARPEAPTTTTPQRAGHATLRWWRSEFPPRGRSL